MVDEVGIVKGLRDYGVKEEFAHVTAVAGRALARQGRRGSRSCGTQTRAFAWIFGSEKIGEYLG